MILDKIFWVFIGGGLGSVVRYVVSMGYLSAGKGEFPWGTLTVNLLGCLLIGLLAVWLEKWQLATVWRLFFITGLLGGFTTFSAFGLETHLMLQQARVWPAVAYVTCSVFLGLLAVLVGWQVGTKTL